MSSGLVSSRTKITLWPKLSHPFGLIGIEDGLSRGCSRGGGQADGNWFSLKIWVDPLVEELFQFLRLQSQNSFLPIDQFFRDHLFRSSDDRLRIHLPISSLKDVERPFLHGELEVLNFMKMLFQDFSDPLHLPVDLGHFLLHLLDGFGCADPGHNIFTLSIHEILTVKDILSCSRVPCKSNPGRRVKTHISKHHGAHIDGGSVRHLWGDVEFFSIIHGPLSHPGSEDRLNGESELDHWVLRKRSSRSFFDQAQDIVCRYLSDDRRRGPCPPSLLFFLLSG